jgi:hypothetical protein
VFALAFNAAVLQAYIELYYAVRALHLSLCRRLRFVKNKWQAIYFIWLLFDKALTGTKPYVLRMRGVVGDSVEWYEWRWLEKNLKGHVVVNMMGTVPSASSSHHFAFSNFHSNLFSQFQVSKSRSFALSWTCLFHFYVGVLCCFVMVIYQMYICFPLPFIEYIHLFSVAQQPTSDPGGLTV